MSTQFRKLNEQEEQALYNTIEKGIRQENYNLLADILHQTEDIYVSYTEQGNFTICTISVLGFSFVGVTKRHPEDYYNPKFGRLKAFARAIRNEATAPSKGVMPIRNRPTLAKRLSDSFSQPLPHNF